MKAMVFAAGLGTRLRPYTNDRPKALVEVQGKSLLEITLLRLRAAGVVEAVVNVHHFADLVIAHLQAHDNFGLTIHLSDERECLLDTGGALKKAAPLLSDAPFLLHNVDILSDLDLRALYAAHLAHPDALSTLAVRQRKTSRYLEFDEAGLLAGWKNARTGAQKISRESALVTDWAYSGIAVIDPRLFAFFPPDEAVFSVVDVWLDAARTQAIRNFPHHESRWLDVGKPEALALAEAEW
jgi:NDP-sugar pyrophosphorylase family protein